MCSWMCHIDDDQYYNVWKLKRMLIKYDPNKPWYIGKSHHGATPVIYLFIYLFILYVDLAVFIFKTEFSRSGKYSQC